MSRTADDLTGGVAGYSAAPGTRIGARLPWLLVAFACAAAALVHSATVASLVGVWNGSDAHSFGWIVAPIAIAIVWWQRRELVGENLSPSVLGLIGLAGASVLWLLAKLLEIQVVTQVMLVAMIGATVLALGGWRFLWRLAFPLAYLLLATPVFSLLVPVLQSMTAAAATAMLRAIGVPVFNDGFFISVPNGDFVVAEFCAGLNYLLATMCVVLLLAWIHRRHSRASVALVFAGIAAALVLNWVRVLIIILAGHWIGMDHWLVHSHITFGWWWFGAGLLVFCFSTEAIMARLDRRARTATENAPSPDAAPTDPPDETPTARPGVAPSLGRMLRLAVLCVAIVAAGPGLSLALDGHPADGAPDGEGAVVTLPVLDVPGWGEPGETLPSWEVIFPHAGLRQVRYPGDGNGREVHTAVAYYARQREGAEAVSELNAVYDRWVWHLARRETPTAACIDGPVEELLLRHPTDGEWLVWSYYYAGGRYTGDATRAKLGQLVDLVRPELGGARIALMARSDGDAAVARETLTAFCADFQPAVTAAINAIEAPAASR